MFRLTRRGDGAVTAEIENGAAVFGFAHSSR
jgi:hypothetical protein